jgi:hypothetical protein
MEGGREGRRERTNNVRTQCDDETGLQAKDCKQPLEAGKGIGMSSL